MKTKKKERIKTRKAFTLIELLISLVIVGMVVAVMYFSLRSALESWQQARIQLSIQKVLNEVMQKMLGNKRGYGVIDAMEIVNAGQDSIEFIPPWIDDTHIVSRTAEIYTLNQKIKPAAAAPICEAMLSLSEQKDIIPVMIVPNENLNASQVQIGAALPIGSKLFFTYYPEAVNSRVIQKIWWNRETGGVLTRVIDKEQELTDLPLGVKITKLKFNYYDNANNQICDNIDSIKKESLDEISGVEIILEAEFEGHKGTLMSFANMRNAPRHSGYIMLHSGSKLIVPDSNKIRAFFLNKFSGVTNGGEFIADLVSEQGKTWRIKMKFSISGSKTAVIDNFSVEYPPGTQVYSECPRRSADLGFDLLAFGTNGMYDYDYDKDAQNVVMLEGKVTLEVIKMDMEGVGVFIRP